MEANAYASSLRLRFRPARRKAGGVQVLKAGQNKKRYKASPSETHSAVVNEFHGVKVVGGEVAEDLFNRGLCLPSGTAMKEKDLDRVVSMISSCKR